MSVDDDRVRAVEEVLARAGIRGTVAVAGHAADVAALTVPPEHLSRLAELAPEIKRLGFRYVAIDLEAGSLPAGDGAA